MRIKEFIIAAVLVVGMRAGAAHDMGAMAPAASASAPAATTGAASAPRVAANIVLSTGVEDGKKQLIATLTREGKPVEGAVIAFGIRRTFGVMPIFPAGKRKENPETDDRGTAAVDFPADVPGDSTGGLQVVATVIAPELLAGTKIETAVAGGRIVSGVNQPFPRALWAPHAPIALIVVILALLAGAWGAFAFVLLQIRAIRKGAIA